MNAETNTDEEWPKSIAFVSENQSSNLGEKAGMHIPGTPIESEAPLASSPTDIVDEVRPPPVESLQIDEMEPPQSPIVDPPQPTKSENILKSPRVSKRATSPRRWSGKSGNEPARARAEEINTGCKVAPKIHDTPGDFFTIDVEIETWFDMSEVCVYTWLEFLQGPQHSQTSQCLQEMLLTGENEFDSVKSLRLHITKFSLSLIDGDNWLDQWNLDMHVEDFASQTLLVFILVAAVDQKILLRDNGVKILGNLLEQIAALRWDVGIDDDEEDYGFGHIDQNVSRAPRRTYLARLFFLTRLAFLATFGDDEALRKTKIAVWRQSGIQFDEHEIETGSYASPINYASFMDEISNRYPSYSHPEDRERQLGSRLKHMNNGSTSKTGHKGMPNDRYSRESSLEDTDFPPDPRDLVNPGNTAIPFVPHSIVEACSLYKSRVKLTPAILQLYDEYQGPHTGDPGNLESKIPEVRNVHELYRKTAPFQKSLIHVIIDFAIQDPKGVSPSVHAALSILWHMLRWFECTHILMFENLTALIMDCQFHLFAHMFCSNHTQLQQYVLEDFPDTGFWISAGHLAHYDGAPLKTDTKPNDLTIKLYNKYNLQTFTHLMGICRLVTAGKTQRLLVAAELPVDPYKSLFNVYEKELWLQMLQYLKSQVPFTGRRWRYLNMEIISAIYLHVPSEIDDNWLSGADISAAIKSAPNEEESLRKIIVAFNKKIRR